MQVDNTVQDEEYDFLTIEFVLELHAKGIDQHSPGESKQVRDMGLLESAVLNPQQTFGGEYLYISLLDIAGAYMIGLCQNHAFINGNKRIGFMACDMYLQFNGYELEMTQDEAVDITLQVANHQLTREDFVQELKQYVFEI